MKRRRVVEVMKEEDRKYKALQTVLCLGNAILLTPDKVLAETTNWCLCYSQNFACGGTKMRLALTTGYMVNKLKSDFIVLNTWMSLTNVTGPHAARNMQTIFIFVRIHDLYLYLYLFVSAY